MHPNINGLTTAWLKYQAEKKAAKLELEKVTPVLAKTIAQRTAQEIQVLERNLTVYRAASRRVRPSMNARVSKHLKKEVALAVTYAEKYLADYVKAFTAWKKLIKAAPKERRVSMFPIHSTHGGRLTDALNSYFNAVIVWIEGGAPGNVAVLPHKSTLVNVRGARVANAKLIKSAGNRLKSATVRADALSAELNRALYELRSTANNRTRSTVKWKAAETKLRNASRASKELKRAHLENETMLIGEIEQLLKRQANAGREIQALKTNVQKHKAESNLMRRELASKAGVNKQVAASKKKIADLERQVRVLSNKVIRAAFPNSNNNA
jgi:hypothetical protein